MSYAYHNKQADAVADLTPPGWDDDWLIPPVDSDSGNGGPWPPGWPTTTIPGPGETPLGSVSDYSLTVTLPATVNVGSSLNVIARTLRLGIDTTHLLNHVIQITATINATSIQLKKTPSSVFANALYYQINNYSGSQYGINVNPIPSLTSSDIGKTINVTCRIVSISPSISGSSTVLVSGDTAFVLQQTFAGDDIAYCAETCTTSNSAIIITDKFSSSVNGVKVYRSTDSGQIFSLVTTLAELGDAFVASSNFLHNLGSGILLACVSVNDGVIDPGHLLVFRSIDDGLTWSRISLVTDPDFGIVSWSCANNGSKVVLGVQIDPLRSPNDFEYYISNDSGATWDSGHKITSGGNSVRSVAYLGSNIWLLGSQESISKIYRSTDDAANFSSVFSFSNSIGVEVIYPVSSSIVLASRQNIAGIYRSIDAGASWSLVTSAFEAKSFLHVGSGVVYALGGTSGSKIYKSTDSGATWTLFQAFDGLFNGRDALVLLSGGQIIAGFSVSGLAQVWRKA